MQAGDDRHIPPLGDRGATELYTRDRNGNILSGRTFSTLRERGRWCALYRRQMGDP